MAEGGGLLNRYRINSPIVGSNPIPSASFKVIISLRLLDYLSAWQDLRFFGADLLTGKVCSVLKILSLPLN